ncbi:hypothetical protein PAXRUDRAFT_836400 [Paxillus rubicundulus Ve08.2h10]|uniref:Unplaced genomic scaffold scaffold_5769, whole genome shotgun sequence n=1 Tax=Paxillus rubicundulus Ve08.2h10 TaxID=930991 RepID=A0A0D0CYU9_9AGAM|nr:hypothetical protein PAXRUDRAFT_836400 [Paxillus rubicundulus Ve08.2h10]
MQFLTFLAFIASCSACTLVGVHARFCTICPKKVLSYSLVNQCLKASSGATKCSYDSQETKHCTYDSHGDLSASSISLCPDHQPMATIGACRIC